MSTKSKEVVEVENKFPVLAGENSGILEIIRENIGEGELNVLDLDAIGIPGGGGTSWEVPTLDGTDSVRELRGVIVAWRSPRFYYALSVEETGGGQPPNCASDDGEVGRGVFGPGSEANPSGRCDGCPMNQWGTATDAKGEPTRGKACRETRQLFMLREDAVLPISVTVPPTSIQPMKKFMLRLASQGVPYYGAVVSLGLEAQQDGGRKWSTVKPALDSVLSPEQAAAARAMGEQLRTAMVRPPVAAPTAE